MYKKKLLVPIMALFAFVTAYASDSSSVVLNAVDAKSVPQKKLFNFNVNNGGINFTDPQKPIIVKKSSPTFSIILRSNPTTGYSWSLKDYDSNLLKPISKKYYPAKPGLAGSGGYEKWVFSVKSSVGFVVPHTTDFTLLYARPWDLQGAQAMNFKVVTVNDD